MRKHARKKMTFPQLNVFFSDGHCGNRPSPPVMLLKLMLKLRRRPLWTLPHWCGLFLFNESKFIRFFASNFALALLYGRALT
jgi:hypothetical protein